MPKMPITLFLSSPRVRAYWFLERVREKRRWVASRMSSGQDQSLHLGMCPDRQLNPQPFGPRDATVTNWATPARVENASCILGPLFKCLMSVIWHLLLVVFLEYIYPLSVWIFLCPEYLGFGSVFFLLLFFILPFYLPPKINVYLIIQFPLYWAGKF